MFDEIRMRWDKWIMVPFPDGASEMEINGVKLVEIDTFSAGCISTFIANRGKLDQERIDILRDCANDLETVLGHLNGGMKSYFTELSEISSEVLESTKS